MRVCAVSGKAFFHKDVLKSMGFKWFRDQKLWVSENCSAEVGEHLRSLEGIKYEITDLPVENLFKRESYAVKKKPLGAEISDLELRTEVSEPKVTPAPVSSLDRARAALVTTAQVVSEPEPKVSAPKLKEIADLLRILADKIAAL